MDKVFKILEYLYSLPSKIAKDKLAHFFASSVLLFLLLLVLPNVYAYVIVFLSALFKEVYHDWYKNKGNAEVLDFVYSVLPILIHALS